MDTYHGCHERLQRVLILFFLGPEHIISFSGSDPAALVLVAQDAQERWRDILCRRQEQSKVMSLFSAFECTKYTYSEGFNA